MTTPRNLPMPFFIDRDEFLLPFDKFFDKMMKESFSGISNDLGVDFFQNGAYPRCDIKEYGDRITIVAEVAGTKKEDIDIELKDGVLSVSGGTTHDFIDDGASVPTTEKGVYLLRELKRSKFRRSFTIGDKLDHDSVGAGFENGILTITIKKIVPKKVEGTKITVR